MLVKAASIGVNNPLSSKIKYTNRKRVPFALKTKKIFKQNRYGLKTMSLSKKFRFITPRKNQYFLRYGLRHDNYKILLLSTLLNKKENIKNIFFFKFINWVLSFFDLRLHFIFNKGNRMVKHKKVKLVLTHGKQRKVIKIEKVSFYYQDLILVYLRLLNLAFSLLKYHKKSALKHHYNIYYMFRCFKHMYYRTFMRKQLKKEIIALNHFSQFSLKGFKLGKGTALLKQYLHNIYNKKVELNLVNLKYLHMNSDNLVKAFIIKLKKNKINLKRVLKNSMKLVKIPKIKYLAVENKRKTFNLDIYKGITANGIADTRNYREFLEKPSIPVDFYTTGVKHKYNGLSEIEIKNVLNSIKYKLVTGIRLEAKGRLTNRFTASRALFRFKYKGSLKNLDYLNHTDLKINYPTYYLTRNQNKPNLQSTYGGTRRRIGTFGVKGWISSN